MHVMRTDAIHLGHMYNAASHEADIMDRDGRVAYSLRLMGGTVVGGAATTAGAGVFMLLSQFSFFLKIGFLVFMTIGYSFVYSFCFFMGGLAMFGPERHQGNLFHLVRTQCIRREDKAVLPTAEVHVKPADA